MVPRQNFKTIQLLIPCDAIISKALMTETMGTAIDISPLVYQLHDVSGPGI